MTNLCAAVFFPVSHQIEAYDYAIPEGIVVQKGNVVLAPVGRQKRIGFVIDLRESHYNKAKLKTLSSVFPIPPLKASLVDFALWMANYTMETKGEVLGMLFRGFSENHPPTVNHYFWSQSALLGQSISMTPARLAVKQALEACPTGITKADLIAVSGASSAVVNGLVEKNVVACETAVKPCPYKWPQHLLEGSTILNDEQETAVQAITTVLQNCPNPLKPFLLDGVTGSGKTEVFLESIAVALSKKQQVLVLVPEIALVFQMMHRIEKRFGVKPACWHSAITEKEKSQLWYYALSGELPIVIGARSALFLPFSNLGLVIVDEEHDPSYKQEEGIRYHARDMAVTRCFYQKVPVVLASATPSLESHTNAQAGKYERLTLRQRFGGATLPLVLPVDLTATPPEKGRSLSPVLETAMGETIARGEQVLLYLNRRGYAPLTLCRRCGFRIQCPNCQAWMVSHQYNSILNCHQCGFRKAIPTECEGCGGTDSFTGCGFGVERIHEEVKAIFPTARTELLSSDHGESIDHLQALLTRMREGEIDILIGTQILAKGHHFPLLTCVGVVDADLGMTGGDLRASERTYQLLEQVSGRSGRGDKSGVVYLQTYQPQHPVIQALCHRNRDQFLEIENDMRREGNYPPYGVMAGIVLSSENEDKVKEMAHFLTQHLPQNHPFEVWGPVPAPFYQLRGRWRIRFLVKGERGSPLQKFLKQWLSVFPQQRDVRLSVDINPYSFL